MHKPGFVQQPVLSLICVVFSNKESTCFFLNQCLILMANTGLYGFTKNNVWHFAYITTLLRKNQEYMKAILT